MQHLELLLAAVRSALGEDRQLSLQADEPLLRRTLSLARGHDLSDMVAAGLARLDVTLPPELSQSLALSAGAAFSRFLGQNRVMERLSALFAKEGIDYLPLKGLVLRELYPQPSFRVGRDIDVLVRPADLERATELLCAALEIVHQTNGGHDVGLETADGVRLELHFSLFHENDGVGELLADPFACALPDAELACCYRLGVAEQLAHLIAHMAKHFMSGGVGLRAFLDLYLLERSAPQAELDRVAELLASCDLLEFAEVVRREARVLFADEQGDADTDRLAAFVCKAKSFGTHGTTAALRLARRDERKRSPLGHLCSRLFPSYRIMSYLYPVLRRAPFLLPVLWGWRGVRIFSKKERARFLAVTRSDFSVDDAAVQEARAIYDYLHLKV